VLDGLEGAAGSQNAPFNRKEMETLLSGLGNRVFLMNNVHEDHPVLFHVRWVMSYLTGPLTRGQIKTLMDPKRAAFESAVKTPEATANPMAMPGVSSAAACSRPVVGPGVREVFVKVASSGNDKIYHPHLLCAGTVHFFSSKAKLDARRTVRRITPITVVINSHSEMPAPQCSQSCEPADAVGFMDLPGYAMNLAYYKQEEKKFADRLYHEERADILECPALKAWSTLHETEGEFRARLAHEAREARDAAINKAREAIIRKRATKQTRLRTAESRLAKEKAGAFTAFIQAGMTIIHSLIKFSGISKIIANLLERKTRLNSVSRASTAIGRASTAYQRSRNARNTAAQVEDLTVEIEKIEADLDEELERIRESYKADTLTLRTESVKPTRAGVRVDEVALMWLPFDSEKKPAW
jgi:uncharacterized membrane protein YqjE